MKMQLGSVGFEPQAQFLLIAGPCVIENLDLCLKIGTHCRDVARRLGLPYIFKASFDKANRSSNANFRGLGMAAGLDVLAKVKERLGVPVTTDVHESHQVAQVAAVVDILQIPAFLCRQTDLLIAAAETGKPVNVKKGQFMAPWEMGNVVQKIQSAGNRQVILTERGTFFGYNRLVNDMTGIAHMQSLNAPVIFDATHSTQMPGGLGTASGGQRQYVGLLAKSATAAGANGLFLEVHPDPDKSPSDAATIMHLDRLEPLLKACTAIRKVCQTE